MVDSTGCESLITAQKISECIPRFWVELLKFCVCIFGLYLWVIYEQGKYLAVHDRKLGNKWEFFWHKY